MKSLARDEMRYAGPPRPLWRSRWRTHPLVIRDVLIRSDLCVSAATRIGDAPLNDVTPYFDPTILSVGGLVVSHLFLLVSVGKLTGGTSREAAVRPNGIVVESKCFNRALSIR